MRRVAVAAAVAVAVLAAGCASSARPRVSAAGKRTLVEEGRGPVVRLGLMAGLTDATGLAGVQLGYFSRQLGSGVMLDPVPFTSGAAETAALAAGQLGAAYVDPVAAVAAWQASDGKLRIVAGVASGGAELVVSKRITRAGQLAGTRLAAPAGSAQAAALRYWLHRLGVPAPAAGRSVAVSGAAAVAAFRAGKLTGAWEPAPFDAQMVADGGHVLVDEAGLWPGGRFATAVLVVTQQFLSAHLAEAEALLKGQVQANDLINTDRAAAQAAAGQELAALLGRSLPARLLAASLAQVTFTDDPVSASILAEARHGAVAGLLKPVTSLAGLYDLGPLNKLLRAAGQPAVRG